MTEADLRDKRLWADAKRYYENERKNYEPTVLPAWEELPEGSRLFWRMLAEGDESRFTGQPLTLWLVRAVRPSGVVTFYLDAASQNIFDQEQAVRMAQSIVGDIPVTVQPIHYSAVRRTESALIQ